MYTDRIARLKSSLESDTFWIAEPGTSSEYFLGGFSSRDWLLSERPLLVSISPSSPNITVLTARFEQSRAEGVDLPREIRDITTFVPWLESESPYDVLRTHFGSEFVRVILDGQVRSFIAEGLGGAGFEKGSDEEVANVKEIRERKDEREIGLLRCANQASCNVSHTTRKDPKHSDDPTRHQKDQAEDAFRNLRIQDPEDFGGGNGQDGSRWRRRSCPVWWYVPHIIPNLLVLKHRKRGNPSWRRFESTIGSERYDPH
jgi:hypothetical protein